MRGETIFDGSIEDRLTFQSTPLMRGETSVEFTTDRAIAFQSTPLMRGETPAQVEQTAAQDISIHSPHARGDHDGDKPLGRVAISIHSPHARGDST